VPAAGAVTPAPSTGSATSTAVDDGPPPAPRGRHARVEDLEEDLDDVPEPAAPDLVEPAPEPAPAPLPRSGGRHARGRSTPSRARSRAVARPAVPFEPLDLDLDRELAPEEVEQIADQMLDQLAVSEVRPRFFDPDEIPGGKFVFMAVLGLAVVVVLVVLYTVLGLIID
jgi:hypothetical protein